MEAKRTIYFTTYPGIEDEALFRGHVRQIRAGMREAFAAIGALERLLTTVDPHVLLQKECQYNKYQLVNRISLSILEK